MKLLSVQQEQFLLSQKERGREECLDPKINSNFVEQSPSANENMKTDCEKVARSQKSLAKSRKTSRQLRS